MVKPEQIRFQRRRMGSTESKAASKMSAPPSKVR